MRGIIIVFGEPARLPKEVVFALELGMREKHKMDIVVMGGLKEDQPIEPQILPIKQLIIPDIKWEETPKQIKKKGYERPYKFHK